MTLSRLIGIVDPEPFLRALATTHDVREFIGRAPKWASKYRNGMLPEVA